MSENHLKEARLLLMEIEVKKESRLSWAVWRILRHLEEQEKQAAKGEQVNWTQRWQEIRETGLPEPQVTTELSTRVDALVAAIALRTPLTPTADTTQMTQLLRRLLGALTEAELTVVESNSMLMDRLAGLSSSLSMRARDAVGQTSTSVKVDSGGSAVSSALDDVASVSAPLHESMSREWWRIPGFLGREWQPGCSCANIASGIDPGCVFHGGLRA